VQLGIRFANDSAPSSHLNLNHFPYGSSNQGFSMITKRLTSVTSTRVVILASLLMTVSGACKDHKDCDDCAGKPIKPTGHCKWNRVTATCHSHYFFEKQPDIDWIQEAAGCAVGPEGHGFPNKHKEQFENELETRAKSCAQKGADCFHDCDTRIPGESPHLCNDILKTLKDKPGALYAITTTHDVCIGEAEMWNKHALVGQGKNVLAAGHVKYMHTDAEKNHGHYLETQRQMPGLEQKIKELEEQTPAAEKAERKYKDKLASLNENYEYHKSNLEECIEQGWDKPPAAGTKAEYSIKLNLDSGHYHPKRIENAWSASLPVWRRCGFAPFIDPKATWSHHSAKRNTSLAFVNGERMRNTSVAFVNGERIRNNA